jgi:hypothetical protein
VARHSLRSFSRSSLPSLRSMASGKGESHPLSPTHLDDRKADLAVPEPTILRRPSTPLTLEDKVACAKWSGRMLRIWAVIVMAMLTLPIFRGESANVSRGQPSDRAARNSLNGTSSQHRE